MLCGREMGNARNKYHTLRGDIRRDNFVAFGGQCEVLIRMFESRDWSIFKIALSRLG
jgi:hypothetical protein